MYDLIRMDTIGTLVTYPVTRTDPADMLEGLWRRSKYN